MSDATLLDRWRKNPRTFCECLINPDTGSPFELLPAECLFLEHMFKLNSVGRLLYPDLVYSCGKKSGKTTFAAILILTTIVLFGGRNAEAYCAANDFDQAQGRVFEMCKRIVEATSFLKNGVKITADRIIFTSLNQVITAITSDAASAAGGAPTISVLDEAWGYRSERARRLWDELCTTPTRKISCRLIVTYAGYVGESELLYELYQRGLKQTEIAPSLYAGDGLLMLWSHEPVAPWQTEAWYAEMRKSLRPTQYARMIENRFVSAESTFIDMELFDQCVDHTMRSVVSDQYLPVWVGVDASVRRDSTALAAVTWSQQNQYVRLVNHCIIQPTADNPLDFEATVERILLDWHKAYNLRGVFYDPYQLISTAQRLTREGLTMIEYPQTIPNLTESSQNLFELIRGRNLLLYPHADIRLAVSRAVAIETPRGWRIGKDKQTHKIDIVVALAMAALAASKRDQGAEGYPPSVWAAAFGDGTSAPEDPDGSTQWRNQRCPPTMPLEEWVRETNTVKLDGAYWRPSISRMWELGAEELARSRGEEPAEPATGTKWPANVPPPRRN